MLLSVIIPTFNRAKHLPFCIKSILDANVKDLEVIIIDDGSTDNTREICDNFKLQDNRIVYLNQPNSGVSAARNYGLQEARGKWIAFCDSDDAVLANHFDIITENAEREATLLMTGSQIVYSQNGTFTAPRVDKAETIHRNNAVEFLFSDEYNPYRQGFFFVWNKFYRRDLLIKNNIRFNEKMSLDEDMHFVLCYLALIHDIIYTNTPTYLTIERPNVSHLGRRKRLPEEYFRINRLNYTAYQNLYAITGVDLVHEFGAYYTIQRTIRLCLIESAVIVNPFVLKTEIIPFLKPLRLRTNEHLDWFSRLLLPFIRLNLPLCVLLIVKIFRLYKSWQS